MKKKRWVSDSSCEKMWKGIILVLVSIYLIDSMYVRCHTVTINIIVITLFYVVL